MTITHIDTPPFSGSHLLMRVENMRMWMLGVTLFFGFLLLIEPAPYEVLIVATMLMFIFTGGLRFTKDMGIFIGLMFLWIFGAFLSLMHVSDRTGTVQWTVIGVYLAITGIFFAAVTAANTEERTRFMLNAYTAGAVFFTFLGILGYFRVLPFSDSLLLYGRVKSTFKDPNVFGPAILLGSTWLMVQLCYKGVWRQKLNLFWLTILALGAFLSFSRATWMQFVLGILIVLILSFIFASSFNMRKRIVLMFGGVIVCMLAGIMVILSIDSIRDLFMERASLVQSYDVGQGGRFNAHAEGFRLMLDYPFGIGMLQAGKYFGVDPHNSYLNAFLVYGWLGGIVFPALMISTLIFTTWAIAYTVPWRPAFIAVYAVMTPHIFGAWLIDLDHWRHFYLLLGMSWGMSIASIAYVRYSRWAAER